MAVVALLELAAPRPLLPGRRLLCRSMGARRSRDHHPRAFRSCVRRLATLPDRGSRREPAPRADWPGCHDRSSRIRAACCDGGHHRFAAPGRPHSRVGADPDRASGRSVGGLRRLQARARSHLRAIRAASLPHLRHGIDFRPADLPLGARSAIHRGDPRLVARQPGRPAKPACFSPTRWARRSGCWRRRRLDRPDPRARRRGARTAAIYREQGVRSRRRARARARP